MMQNRSAAGDDFTIGVGSGLILLVVWFIVSMLF